jgi:mannose-6-phosphate isomerase
VKQKIFRLHGQVQHYAWGGYKYIPNLLGFDNAQHQPCAEYWMGTHPRGAGKIDTENGTIPWPQLIQENPEGYLGENTWQKFGELPYLFKVLDVREMLSIQVHPSKAEAAKGFDAEEAAGIPITAPNRNYKDRNHKPEVMIALGDFWLLHGFKKEGALRHILRSTKGFAGLEKMFDEGGYYGLYKYVMEMPQTESDELLLPLIQLEATLPHTKETPGYWVNKLYGGNIPAGNFDKGIFSIYFFNIVRLKKGEGIFQPAGVPHAYLEGQNVELMANSDNVLRGGLTPKHIDVAELLKHISFEGIEPHVLTAQEPINGEVIYQLPVDDFGIGAIHLKSGREYVNNSVSPETFLVINGEVQCGEINSKKGEAFVVFPEAEYTIRAVEDAVIYRAYVP